MLAENNVIIPLFITCSVESIDYRRGVVTNKPVNLSLCKSVEKVKYAWYPDNEGKPAIRFNGCDVEWVYHYASERDADFQKIINNEYK